MRTIRICQIVPLRLQSRIMKRLLITFSLFLLVLIAAIFSWNHLAPVKIEPPVHYHAGFRVYIDGTLQDYSDTKYMNYTMCSATATKPTKSEDQEEKAHLHDGVDDVVHVERNGATWGDLFTNIKVQFPKDKPLVGYIDGKKIADIMHTPITAYTTAIFVVGTDAPDHSQEVVPLAHIKEVEATSEICGKN